MNKSNILIKQVNERGGLTLPSEIRKFMKLNSNDHVSFKINQSGSVEIVKVEIKEIKHPIEKQNQ